MSHTGPTGPTVGADARADVVIVGAGIVGLATARALHERRPSARIIVLDKEPRIAAHQSGRNSGVIHAGVYYKPGSAKARLCRAGRTAMLEFCAAHDVPHEVTGKVVVATSAAEIPRLDALAERCRLNELEAIRIDRRELAELEPHADGVAALRIPATGIVDYKDVCRALAADLAAAGVDIRTDHQVQAIHERADTVTIETNGGTLRAGSLVNCGGLHSDRIARSVEPAVPDATPTILPFRGEYFELTPARRHLVRNLIYPVPDPDLPFLGVHFTRDIHGGVHAGPNAVLALGREAYTWRIFNARDVAEIFRTRSTWHLARTQGRTEIGEVTRSLFRSRFVKALQRLVPDVRDDDLVRADAGIRAQAVAPDGSLLDDFAFASTARTLHVLNAPSPAATASLAIGAEIADRVLSGG